MSHYLNWNIVGFYDSKELRIKNGISPKECVFLDIEILRNNIKSVGHHMITHNINELPDDYFKRLNNCINPNTIRGFDRIHNFPRKYPLGTVHFLLFILGSEFSRDITINKDGFGAIFFADGIWKILFKYTANFLDWFNFLEVGSKSEWWDNLKKLSVVELIQEMEKLFKDLRGIHPAGRSWYGHVFRDKNVEKSKQNTLLVNLLKLFGDNTGWAYKPSNWLISDLETKRFTKKIYNKEGSNRAFLRIWSENPLSLAMTRGKDIEYTIEGPDSFL
jgi:hypothetical protein